MRALLVAIFGFGLILTAASFGHAVHPAADSLAVFRYAYVLVTLFAGVFLVRRRVRWLAVLLLFAGVVADPLFHRLNARVTLPETGLRLYQKNLFYGNDALPDLELDITAARADFVTLEEVWWHNTAFFERLGRRYREKLLCRGSASRAVAVLSQYPRDPARDLCVDGLGLAAMRVETDAGPLWVVAIHLRWPWPFGQDEQVRQVIPYLQALDAPAVIGGDFNSVPWSGAVKRVAQSSGSRRAGPVLRTFHGGYGGLRLPIDHVLTPDGRATVQTRSFLGSDHKGLLAVFDYPSAPPS